jgi:acetyl-CoA C-acetyltransferase
MTREVIVASGVRTAIGSFGGGLKSVPPCELGAAVLKEALHRAGIDGKDVGHVVFGHVINTEPRDMYLSRVAAINGGCPKETPAMNVDRLCGSGLQAIVSASQSILLGDCDVAVGAGAESMSRAPFASLDTRWGARMGDAKMVDMMVGALHDPFDVIHMGVTAENVAHKFHITREEQDALALESHHRAERAWKEGRFNGQILPITIKSRKGDVVFEKDEHFRTGAKLEDFQKLKPVFAKGDGTVTAGNASGLNDAAAAVVLMEAGAARTRGVKPMARLVGYAHAGVDPRIMGIGPVPATKAVLARTGLKLDQMDVIEANEAFAAQACAVSKELGFNPEKVNPNGSGISLGHPIGATGAVLTVKAVYELQRIQGRYALVTMCIGGGQGIAAIFERLA